MKKYLPLVFALCASLLTACTTINDPYASYRHLSSTDIFYQAEVNLAKGDDNAAISQLEAINALHPFGHYAEQVQLDLIYAYYEADQASMAVAAADRYLHLYPRGIHADYAYYMKGIIGFSQGLTWMQRLTGQNPALRDPTNLQRSFRTFQVLVTQYPHSIYRNDALKRMAYIRNALANTQLAIAQYYMKRKAYIAAANHANTVILHYEGAPAVHSAITLSAKAYAKLNLPVLASKTRRLNSK